MKIFQYNILDIFEHNNFIFVKNISNSLHHINGGLIVLWQQTLNGKKTFDKIYALHIVFKNID